MISKSHIVLAAVTLLSLAKAQQIVQIVDASNFCTMLPPNDSSDRIIADTEGYAQAFCMGNTPGATGANSMPSGFIQSAHFASGSDYVQITGTINPLAANLVPTDEGGQYDIKAPDGSSCAGYSYYVNLVEPANNIFCIRCCNDASDCNRGISEKGCLTIVPGDYSGGSGVVTPPSNPSQSDTEVQPPTTVATTPSPTFVYTTTPAQGLTTTGNPFTTTPGTAVTTPIGGSSSQSSQSQQSKPAPSEPFSEAGAEGIASLGAPVPVVLGMLLVIASIMVNL